MMVLRPYQNRACNAVEKSFSRDGFNRSLAVLATAAGKTVIFSRLARHWINEQRARVLILADRDELISQAVAKLDSAAGLRADVEKAKQRAALDSPLVVSSIQTMSKRLAKWKPGSFSHIIADEAHLAMAGNFQRTLKHLCGFHPEAELPLPPEPPRVFDDGSGPHRAVRVLGVTATPFRSDKKRLCDFFETIAYEHSCFELIEEGYLSPIKVRMIPLKISLDDVKTKQGDFEEQALSDAIEPHFEAIVEAIKIYAPGRRILAFHPLCSTSRKFVAVCRAQGINAEHIEGESADRKDLLAAFAAEDCRFTVLSNSALLTTGVDIERVDCILNLRPTKSATLFQQIIGRGTRILPGVIDGLDTPEARRAAIAASAKKECLVLDCLWQYEKMGVQRPANLFAQGEEEAQEISDLLEASDGQLDLIEAGQSVAADRERRLRERLLANAKRKGRYFDASVYAAAIRASESLLAYEPINPWESLPPTESQAEVLEKHGIAGVTCRGHASQVIDSIIKRSKEGLATPRQLRHLIIHNVEDAETKTFEEASELLEEIFHDS